MIVWNGDEPDPLPGWWEQPRVIAVVFLGLAALKCASYVFGG